MASVVSICNSALVEIGEPRITSLTESNKPARECNEHYEEQRDNELREHLWNFAAERVKLAKLSSTPAFEFDNEFQLPADWLRTVTVHDNDAGRGTALYKLEGRKILSNAEDIYLRYVRRIVDPDEMTPDFREALAARLGRKLAVSLANSNEIAERMQIRHRRLILKAKSIDAIEDFPEQMPESSWVTARHRGHGSTWGRC